MSFQTLRSKIQTKLEAISNIQKVIPYPAVPDSSGMPAATITPSEADSDYETTTDNKRVYGFVVRLFYETKDGGTSNAVAALEGLVDEVVDAFDQDPQLSGISMPSRYQLIQLIPTPSVWGYFIDAGYIMAEVKLSALISYDMS